LQYAWVEQAPGADPAASSASAVFTPLFAAGRGARALEGFRRLSEVGAELQGWLAH
jgi:hypothetical protein